jgi:hypothetical protein
MPSFRAWRSLRRTGVVLAQESSSAVRFVKGFTNFLRMPLKRVPPSFIVEYRQTRQRPSPGGVKLSWADTNRVPRGPNKTTHRDAISVFNTASAEQPAEVVAPSISAGRILPSLVEAEPLTAQSSSGARQTGHITPAPVSQTAARPLSEPIHAAKGLEPPLAVASTLVPEQPVTSHLGVAKVARPRLKKRTGHPAERQEKLVDAAPPPPSRSDIALTNSPSDLPAVGEPSSTVRKGRILGRYVFRDELRPGETWKRRIETRRERRA